MSGYELTLLADLSSDIDMSPLQPLSLAELPIEKVRKLRLPTGRKTRALGDLFAVKQGGAAGELAIKNSSRRLRRIGRAMEGGCITIDGDCGDELGVAMRAGHITCQGNVADYAGANLQGGMIKINGRAGDFAGGALPGESLGMRNGALFVNRGVGARTGDKMRRGLIFIHGDTGPYCASNLIAGTLIVTGKAAQGLGTGMRRGTIVLLNDPDEMPPAFNDCGSFPLTFLHLLLMHIKTLDQRSYNRLRNLGDVTRYVGDIGADGQGEILIADTAKS